MGHVDHRGVYTRVGGAGDIWEISVPFSQFCYDTQTALKNKVFKKTETHNLLLGKINIQTKIHGPLEKKKKGKNSMLKEVGAGEEMR